MTLEEAMQAAGGNWGGILTKDQFLEALNRVGLAQHALLLEFKNQQGKTGTYVIPHVEDIAHFR